VFPASFCGAPNIFSGSLAGNAKMTAIQSARKQIHGNFDSGNSLSRNDDARHLHDR
jgi:hypothetical protein